MSVTAILLQPASTNAFAVAAPIPAHRQRSHPGNTRAERDREREKPEPPAPVTSATPANKPRAAIANGTHTEYTLDPDSNPDSEPDSTVAPRVYTTVYNITSRGSAFKGRSRPESWSRPSWRPSDSRFCPLATHARRRTLHALSRLFLQLPVERHALELISCRRRTFPPMR